MSFSFCVLFDFKSEIVSFHYNTTIMDDGADFDGELALRITDH